MDRINSCNTLIVCFSNESFWITRQSYVDFDNVFSNESNNALDIVIKDVIGSVSGLVIGSVIGSVIDGYARCSILFSL